MAMKDSGIAWIGEIPENWSIKPLKFLFDMYAGGDVDEYNTSDEQTVNYNYPIYSNSLENNGLFGYTNKYRFEGKTFTVTGRGAVGNAIARFDKYYPIVRLLVCVPKNNDDNRYYTYCVNSADLLGEQTAMAQLTTLKLGMTKHPVPPIMEQQLIADFLDDKVSKIDDILDNLNKQVEILNAYKKSLITETVTKGLNPNAPMKDSGIDWIGEIPELWETKKLKYLTNLIIDGTHNTPTYVDEGVPFLRVTDITSGGAIDIDSVAKIPIEEHLDINKRCCPQKGDLLVSKNGTIGVPKLIDWDWDFSIFVSLCLIKTKSFLLSKYLLYYFKSSLIDSEIAFGGKTNTITNLHLEKIANFVIPVTSIDEQECIVEYLDKKCAEIDDLIADKTAQIEKMEKYKKSLIFEYVTGKKRVKEVV